MTSGGRMEFLVLGPLEARVGGAPISLGGGKQRAVLGVLLLRAGEVVSVERLIDEVWGDDPPPSASHSLEAYVSRIRQLLNGHGPRVLRRGAGYVLELGDASLDARDFEELAEEAWTAAAEGRFEESARVAARALALSRGPALADVALAAAGRADAERLEELRLRVFENRVDAELALGRHERVVGELQALVGQNPYRERFVAQLMLALYRSGRQADALDAYEQTRRRLDDDLGLQPSTELQQLSGQIVRQDAQLRRPAAVAAPVLREPSGTRRRRGFLLVATGAVVSAALALAATGGAAVPERPAVAPKSLALVLPGSVESVAVAAGRMATAIDNAESVYDLQTQTAFVRPEDTPGDVRDVVERIRTGGVGLVVVLGDGPGARLLAKVVRSMPETRFVFVDASVSELSLEGVQNAAAIRFSDEDALYLGGYLSGLMPTKDGSKRRVDRVSIVAGEPTRDTRRLIAAFERGLHETQPRAEIRIDYSRQLEDVTACERLANRQIDDGSDVVVALAGRCSLGAMEVASIRNVWSIGLEEDGIPIDDDILFAVNKEWSRSTLYAVEKLISRTLPMGRDTVLGLEDDYAVTMWFSYQMPEDVASAVIERCSEIRAARHRDI